MSFLQIATHNIGPGGRAAGIRKWDVLLAVDGEIFTEEPQLLYLKFQNRRDAPWLLTLKRKNEVFDVLVYLPFVADFIKTDENVTNQATELIKKHRFMDLADYRNFEVYRDIVKNVDLVDTRPNPFVTLIAPIWMLHNRLYLLLFLAIAIYCTTFFAHFYVFALTVILVGLYTQRHQIDLKRAYCQMLEKKLWMVVASDDELKVVEKVIAIDNESRVRHFVSTSRRAF